MTWAQVMGAIQTAVAQAAGLSVLAVEWQHTGRDGSFMEYPRVKLIPAGNRTVGLPEERFTWVPAVGNAPAFMRREVWSVNLLRVQVRIESDSTMMGDGGLFSPADRMAKVLRTPAIGELLEASRVSLLSVNEFGPFQVTAENRELAASVAECLFQVNLPVDTTPENGADWFNRVELHNRVDNPERVSTVFVPETPEVDDFMGDFTRTFPMTGAINYMVSDGWNLPGPIDNVRDTSGMLGDGTVAPRFFITGRNALTACGLVAPNGLRLVFNQASALNDCWPTLDGGAAIVIPLPVHDRIVVEFILDTNLQSLAPGGGYFFGARFGLVEFRSEAPGGMPRALVGGSLVRYNMAFAGNTMEEWGTEGVGGNLDVSATVSGGRIARRVKLVIDGVETRVESGDASGTVSRQRRVDPYRRTYNQTRAFVLGLGHGISAAPVGMEFILGSLTISGTRY